MQALKENKIIISVVAIFILGMFLYKLLFKPADVLIDPGLSASVIGDELLDTYKRLEAVNLDQSLFSSPGFLSLEDFSIDVSPQPSGRPNPFDTL